MFTLDIFNKHFETPFQFHFTDKERLSDIIKELELQLSYGNNVILEHGYNKISMFYSDYAGYRVTDMGDATIFQLDLQFLQNRLHQEFIARPRIIPVKSH